MLARLLSLALLGSLLAAPAAAQVAWESPLLASPHVPDGLAPHFVSHRQARGGPLGAALAWRPGGSSLGLRVGGDDVTATSTTLALGMELGADVAFGRGRDFTIHLGAAVGDRAALVIGIGRGPVTAPLAITNRPAAH